MLAHLPERESLNYARSRPRGLDLILSLADALPDAAKTALDETIRSRALVLDEMAARRSGRPGSEGESELWLTLAAARQRLAHLVVRGPGAMPSARYTALLDEARRDSELAEQKLAERSAEFREELSRARIGLSDVTDATPGDAAVVSFVRYTRLGVVARIDRGADRENATRARRAGRALLVLLSSCGPGERLLQFRWAARPPSTRS